VVLFQSSPSGEAGCYPYIPLGRLPRYCFNPHPAVKLGATPFALVVGMTILESTFARIDIITAVYQCFISENPVRPLIWLHRDPPVNL
jgi:hypothetical protein